MTWSEICEDKLLATLPYRIESDRWGNIVMTFLGPAGRIPESRFCPGFPKRIPLDG